MKFLNSQGPTTANETTEIARINAASAEKVARINAAATLRTAKMKITAAWITGGTAAAGLVLAGVLAATIQGVFNLPNTRPEAQNKPEPEQFQLKPQPSGSPGST